MTGTTGREYVEPGIYRRPGRGNYIVILKVNGKQYTEALPAWVTLRDARIQVAILRNEARRGLPVAPARMTVEHLLVRWLDDRQITAKSHSTWRADRVNCCYWRDTIGEVKLRKLRAAEVERARDELLEQLAAKSVTNALSTLRSALKWAVRHDLLERNVAAVVKPPAVTRFESHWATPDEARRLLTVFERHGPPYGTMLAIALLTSMRVESEWGAMRWQDVDLEHKLARLVHARMQDGTVIPAGNRKHKRREVPLSAAAVRFLEMQRAWQVDKETAMPGGWRNEGGYVFTNPQGARVRQSTLQRTFERMQREANVPRMRVHDLRHTGASLLLLAGVHPKVVSELLGHNSVRTTLDWYSHLMPGIAESAAETLGRVVSSAPGDVLGDTGQAA